MQLARPRHARPVLGSYLNARAKRDLTARPVREAPGEPVEIHQPVEVPAGPTVGQAWELDTFTAPVRGRKLGAKEKFGIGVTGIGLIALGLLMLRPAPLREDTRRGIALAATAPIGEEETAADFARTFLTTLGEEWSPRVFFKNVAPSFWPASAAAANALAAHYTEGFDTLREHGRVLGIDFAAPPTAAGDTGAVLPCTLDFSDGTALRATIRLARGAEARRWFVVALTVSPALP